MKIVAATDGSRGGIAAVRFAARLASRLNETELVILTIGTPGQASVPASNSTVLRGVAPKYRFVPAKSVGFIPEAISLEADRLKADLVVIGSEGRDTLSEWVVGGVALRLIYVARRPVVVVRPPRRRRGKSAPSA
jgi:nucleotide-binding universal stress UspA family protein